MLSWGSKWEPRGDGIYTICHLDLFRAAGNFFFSPSPAGSAGTPQENREEASVPGPLTRKFVAALARVALVPELWTSSGRGVVER
jgi:hypothetical protein